MHGMRTIEGKFFGGRHDFVKFMLHRILTAHSIASLGIESL